MNKSKKYFFRVPKKKVKMVLQNSGVAIKVQDIETEFVLGTGQQKKLNADLGPLIAVAANTTISFSTFYGKAYAQAVTGISFTSVGQTSVTVNWSGGGAGATSFSISTSPAGTTNPQSATASGYSFTGLSASTTYTFTITSINAQGVSGGTATGSVTTAAAAVAPVFTISPYVSSITTTSLTVSWVISGTTPTYVVYYKTSGAGSYTSISSATNPQVISSLVTDTVYNVYVTATNAAGTATSSVYTQSTQGSTTLYTMPSPFTFTTLNGYTWQGPTSITYAQNATSWPGYGTAYQLSLGTGTSAGMQLWTVPQSKVYQFRVVGAGYQTNGTLNAYGADFTVSLPLTKNHVIRIAVGQQSVTDNGNWEGGGGGTWVYNNTTSTLLFVAGGNGGNNINSAGGSGQAGRNGGDGNNGGGAGGTNGNGGSTSWGGGNAGGGYLTNGANVNGATADGYILQNGWNGGFAFVNGAQGGTGTNQPGGFGGGGSGSVHGVGGGGGGGYSGGGGGNSQGGGGGGSYSLMSLTVTLNTLTNLSQGFLIIT